MREKIINLAKANGADIVRFAPASRFGSDSPILKIIPETILQTRGFKIQFLISIFMDVECFITTRLMVSVVIRLVKSPAINASIPVISIKKYMDIRFITDETKLFIKIIFCLRHPLSIPDKVI